MLISFSAHHLYRRWNKTKPAFVQHLVFFPGEPGYMMCGCHRRVDIPPHTQKIITKVLAAVLPPTEHDK